MTGALADPGLGAARTHALRTLFAGVGLGSTGYIAAGTVSAIVATELAGTSSLAGVPAVAIGVLLLAAVEIEKAARLRAR